MTNTYIADAIRTPIVSYLLADHGPANFNGQNRALVPLTPLHPHSIDYILSFASSSPPWVVGSFVHVQTGIHIASGEIGHLLNPETLGRYAQLFYDCRTKFANSQRNGPSKNRDMEIAKNAYIVSVWEALLAQKMGKNALPYCGEAAAACESSGRIKIADSMGGERHSPEPFEIQFYQILGRKRKNGEVYSIETLTLELIEKVKGEGAEDFFKKFQESK